MNLQNQPATREFRNNFVARPGYKLVVCDLSSIEMVILADQAEEELLIRAFNRDRDPHVFAASLLNGKPYEEIEDGVKRYKAAETEEELALWLPYKKMRDEGKTFNYASMYLQTIFGLMNTLACSQFKARSLQERYFANFRQIKPWQERVIAFTRENGYIRTASGRIRYIDGINSEDDFIQEACKRVAVNTVIQGTAGDGMKYALALLLPRLAGFDARLLAVVHDEVVVEVREDQSKDVDRIVQDTLIEGNRRYIRRVKVKVDSHIVDRWGEAK